MKKSFDLEFCFKGNRTYVQGPDIFDAVMIHVSKNFNNIENVKYSAYSMLHKNATVIIVNKLVKSDYRIINSLITFITEDSKYYAVVSENDQLIECYTDYSETIVKDNSIIYENTISFKNLLPDSYSEIVVSMNKYYLNQVIKEEGKWIVTKFDYFNLEDINLIKHKEIKVELLQNFNNKLTKSLLFLNNKAVGHLYFSLIPKED